MMTARLDHVQLLHRDEVVAPPALEQRACTDQTFELPGGLYAAMGILFAGMVAVLASAFQAKMVVSYGVVFAFLAAFFAIPAIFVKAAPRGQAKSLSWFEFRNRGIDTCTGRTPAGEATALVLTLPVLIFCWAVAVAIIAAAVR